MEEEKKDLKPQFKLEMLKDYSIGFTIAVLSIISIIALVILF